MAEPGTEPERGREPVTAEAVLRELRLFELRCQGEEVPDKLVELCLSHGLGPVALANELLAFVTSKDLEPQLTPEGLDAFEHEVLAKRGRRGRDERRGLPHDIHSLQELLSEEQEDELLDAYATPSKGSQKRSNSTPETPRPKRAPSSRSPYGLFSPGSFSPSVTPSQKYSSRGGRGEVVASFGSEPGPAWRGRGGCSVRVFGNGLGKPYKFMFQKALDVREVLASRVEELGEVLRRHHGLDGFSSTALPAQEPVTVLGHIGCDGNGRLNPQSVLLLGDREHSGGAPVPLDLSELQEYSLFPGQVLAVEGTNSTGRRLVVSRLYEGVPLPFHSPTEPMAEQRMVLVACGPFTPSDGVAFEPLSDLLELVGRERPDVLLLFGPFLDAKHEQVESCQLPGSFSDVFRLCLRTIVEGTRSAGCQLVLVPSLRDVCHDFVYPQPPFPCQDLPKEDRARVLLVSEPCTLDIDGVVFGLSSTDLLLHLGAEEISSSSGISDRFTRILRHVLTQRSFYPLYPPSEELNVDLEALAAFAALPVTPDVLVTPSELRFFIKDVLGCVCINPGRLTKGRTGGTYGRLLLRRDRAGDRAGDNGDRAGDSAGDTPGDTPRDTPRSSPCVAAQVVRI
ncbi:DNA polymerase alpha subunit B isoform X2 [Catharus ustulatus]|uniref:DNA polymerase alpha subunit B isoform X2 n=1 Tax=Catharus ustulatus TaxID=91951 RepID=UPI0014086170|nr:DNA polymerase alpha subunit B isoform X2 [Catharus ustulatus]